jgi:hypothetical protein
MNRHRAAGLIWLPVFERMAPREEVIQILAEGLVDPVIRRSQQPESLANRRDHRLRVQIQDEYRGNDRTPESRCEPTPSENTCPNIDLHD